MRVRAAHVARPAHEPIIHERLERRVAQDVRAEGVRVRVVVRVQVHEQKLELALRLAKRVAVRGGEELGAEGRRRLRKVVFVAAADGGGEVATELERRDDGVIRGTV